MFGKKSKRIKELETELKDLKEKAYIRNAKGQIVKLKSLVILSAVFLLSSCDVFFSSITFKVIGSGRFNISYIDNAGSTTFSGGAQTFKREMSTDEVWVLSAQSQNGSGVKVEAYLGNQLLKTQSASGYGVASISGTY